MEKKDDFDEMIDIVNENHRKKLYGDKKRLNEESGNKGNKKTKKRIASLILAGTLAVGGIGVGTITHLQAEHRDTNNIKQAIELANSNQNKPLEEALETYQNLVNKKDLTVEEQNQFNQAIEKIYNNRSEIENSYEKAIKQKITKAYNVDSNDIQIIDNSDSYNRKYNINIKIKDEILKVYNEDMDSNCIDEINKYFNVVSKNKERDKVQNINSMPKDKLAKAAKLLVQNQSDEENLKENLEFYTENGKLCCKEKNKDDKESVTNTKDVVTQENDDREI